MTTKRDRRRGKAAGPGGRVKRDESQQPTGDRPVVEANPAGDAPDLTLRALNLRIRQQEILSELGVLALQSTPLSELIDRTAELTAEGLQADFCKVMEYLPEENRLLVRAGVGWGPGVVGVATVGADLASPAGFALRTGQPVISNHLENEERFRTPELLLQNGIRRAMNVILQGDNSPFGVLEVDSRSEGEFVKHDLAFLQGAANILGMAIERLRYERSLKAAIERQQMLIKEINHRVKNSLAIVRSLLNLQARSEDNADLAGRLELASSRIAAIARAHERLYRSDDVERLDLAEYLGGLCQDLEETIGRCTIDFDASDRAVIATDRGIHVALIVTELVTNAAKYAYPDEGGPIHVRLTRQGDVAAICVQDEGVGAPPGFDAGGNNSMGLRIVAAMTKQLGATIHSGDPRSGAEVCLRVPLSPAEADAGGPRI